jgi:predicted house-cleaning noncanonical NTP pyrophosphatase (MazG superfamily)
MLFTHTETDLPIESDYPKLVRDNIPEIIQANGKAPVTHIAGDNEYVSFLLKKIVEEATELRHAQDINHQKEEIADVLEVLDSIKRALGLTDEQVLNAQVSKREERGSFEGRIILDEITE